MPRRVLIVAYFFPPLGGAGVQRTLKWARYLPSLGWHPTILTVRSRDYWMADASLADELGPNVTVVRTASLTGLSLLRRLAPGQAGRPGRPRRSTGILGRLRRAASWAFIPDSYVGWIPFARREGARILSAKRHDAILTTSSPDSAHLIGRALARRFHLPWIADFRDPWTRRMSFDPPTRWHARCHRRLERGVLHEAARITVTAEETRADFLNRDPDLDPAKIEVLTNGFDEADFTRWGDAQPRGSRMQILHAGQLNPERPAAPFLRGLRHLLDIDPAARAELRVRFLGPFYAGDAEAAERWGLSDVVSFEPALPHREVVGELLQSHLLLLMEQDSPRGGLILPGKIFEYLRSRRPILGLLPRGAAWNLITNLGAGRCCATEDAETVAQVLGDYVEAFRQGGPPPTGLSPETLHGFERGVLAQRLANVLEQLADRAGPRRAGG